MYIDILHGNFGHDYRLCVRMHIGMCIDKEQCDDAGAATSVYIDMCMDMYNVCRHEAGIL